MGFLNKEDEPIISEEQEAGDAEKKYGTSEGGKLGFFNSKYF